MRRLIMGGLAFLFIHCSWAANVVNVYAWSHYIPPNVIKKFEVETGIHVNLSEYDSNSVLYAKLKAAPHIGYDVIIPSSYYVNRMVKQDMLHRLDHTKIPNIKYLNPKLMNLTFDRDNYYSLPYLWGTTGIIINKRFWNPKKITRWQDLWNPRFHNQLLMLDDSREVFAIGLLKLGYSINTRSPQQIKQAYSVLRQLMPNIKVFNSDALTNLYADGDITIGMSWNGEAYLATQENPNLTFIYPRDGFSVWIDCLAIPKYAPHLANAYRFINFLQRPDIAKLTALSNEYSTPNLGALKLLPLSYRHSKIINPSISALKNGHTQLYVGQARQIYQRYWELLKLGDSG